MLRQRSQSLWNMQFPLRVDSLVLQQSVQFQRMYAQAIYLLLNIRKPFPDCLMFASPCQCFNSDGRVLHFRSTAYITCVTFKCSLRCFVLVQHALEEKDEMRLNRPLRKMENEIDRDSRRILGVRKRNRNAI